MIYVNEKNDKHIFHRFAYFVNSSKFNYSPNNSLLPNTNVNNDKLFDNMWKKPTGEEVKTAESYESLVNGLNEEEDNMPF